MTFILVCIGIIVFMFFGGWGIKKAYHDHYDDAFD
jgi:hypothetical protein